MWFSLAGPHDAGQEGNRVRRDLTAVPPAGRFGVQRWLSGVAAFSAVGVLGGLFQCASKFESVDEVGGQQRGGSGRLVDAAGDLIWGLPAGSFRRCRAAKARWTGLGGGGNQFERVREQRVELRDAMIRCDG